jgi:uncharacterized membrane protein YqjE
MATQTDTRTDLQHGSEPSFSSLVQGIVSDVQALIKQHLELFKVEMQSDYTKTRSAALPLVLGLMVLLVGVLLLGIFLAQGLHAWVPDLSLWGAYGIVGAVVTGFGAVLAFLGYYQFTTFNPLPDETLDALKENLKWPTNPK